MQYYEYYINKIDFVYLFITFLSIIKRTYHKKMEYLIKTIFQITG